MNHSLAYARDFARLVELALKEPQASDGQLAILLALSESSRHGNTTISTSEWHLLVDGVPVTGTFPGAQELTAQLIGHAIREVLLTRNASPLDLASAARVLASEPAPGSNGRAAREWLESLGVTAVKLEITPDARLPVPSPVGDQSAFDAPTPPSQEQPSNARLSASGVPTDDSVVREDGLGKMFTAFAVSGDAAAGSLGRLFTQLDEELAKSELAATRHLDSMVRFATESAGAGRSELAAEMIVKLIERERSATATVPRRRMMTMAIRRLCIPMVLDGITALLPRHRESYDPYMAVIERAGEVGVESLVDSLVSAPSLADRRLYFDALLKLNAGVRTLVFMLGDERWFVVRNAVELLGEMRVAEADTQLINLLHHADDRVRAAAAAALAKIGTASALRGLLRTVREAATPEARHRAATALSASGVQSVEVLAEALRKEEDGRVQMALLTALAQIGTPEAVEQLVQFASAERGLFRRRTTPLRVAAITALGDVPSAAARRALGDLARDKEKEVRGAASWILLGRRRKKGKKEGE